MLINVTKIETTKMKILVKNTEFKTKADTVCYVAETIDNVGINAVVSTEEATEQEILVENMPIELRLL